MSDFIVMKIQLIQFSFTFFREITTVASWQREMCSKCYSVSSAQISSSKKRWCHDTKIGLKWYSLHTDLSSKIFFIVQNLIELNMHHIKNAAIKIKFFFFLHIQFTYSFSRISVIMTWIMRTYSFCNNVPQYTESQPVIHLFLQRLM